MIISAALCEHLMFVLKGKMLSESCLQTEAPVDIEMSARISIDDSFGGHCPKI